MTYDPSNPNKDPNQKPGQGNPSPKSDQGHGYEQGKPAHNPNDPNQQKPGHGNQPQKPGQGHEHDKRDPQKRHENDPRR